MANSVHNFFYSCYIPGIVHKSQWNWSAHLLLLQRSLLISFSNASIKQSVSIKSLKGKDVHTLFATGLFDMGIKVNLSWDGTQFISKQEQRIITVSYHNFLVNIAIIMQW